MALNDYTITERGDVGSNVRLEALSAISSVALPETSLKYDTVVVCFHSIQRLALEKLDKVRLEAAKSLQFHGLITSLTCVVSITKLWIVC